MTRYTKVVHCLGGSVADVAPTECCGICELGERSSFSGPVAPARRTRRTSRQLRRTGRSTGASRVCRAWDWRQAPILAPRSLADALLCADDLWFEQLQARGVLTMRYV